ncbi:MAG: hypothetical protein K2M91_10580 [Lachnospiraceae bacterium]|nr:hypothetical protein [Lachnospiraceae bacterium]
MGDSIRLLKADEIECRIATVNEKGLSLLLYKDARVDQKILDETFGMFGWKRSHQCIDGDLYSAPFIWVPAAKVQIQKKDNRFYCNENFQVASITYNASREISGLSITGDKGKSIFEWKVQDKDVRKEGSVNKEPDKKEPDKKDAVRKESLSKSQMKGLETELKRTGVAMEAVQRRYHVDDPMQMSEETYIKVMKALSKTKSTDAAGRE